METRHNLLMILIQIGVGSVASVSLAVAGYFLTNSLFLNAIIGDRVQHGFWVGLFTLLAFLLTYCSGVAGSAYGIKQVAKQFGQHCNLKHAWQGAFLGPPALAVLVMTTQLNWQTLTESFGVNSLLSLVIVIIRPLARISSFPISVLLKNGIPVELLYALSAPIGAIVGYRFDWHRSGEISETIEDIY